MKNLLFILLSGITLAASPVEASGTTPACDSLDRHEKHSRLEIGRDFLLRGDKLVLTRDDEVVVTITRDRELKFDGETVQLTREGQALVNAYYENMDKALNEFASLAGDAASLGITAAGTAIYRLLTGELDEKEFEAEVEAKAREIENRANSACIYLHEVERLEEEMATEIPGFRPVMFPDRHDT